MSYEDIEQSEDLSEQTYLYLIQMTERTLAYTNAPITISATIDGTDYDFIHPRGGIWHGSSGTGASDDKKRNDAGPTQSSDAGRSGIELHVAHTNPVVRAHRSFPPPGDTAIDIYRQNEIDGEPQPELTGYVLTECPIEGSTGILRCQHITELVSGSEGLSETFGPTCPYMFGHFPCPVSIPAATDNDLVVEDIDTENFTITVSGSIRIAGKYKAGVLIAPNDDKRLILDDTVDLDGNHVLTILQNFPSTTLRIGDVISAIRGCDRLQQTCRDEWGEFTGNGAAFGGNNLQVNKNPHQVGRIQ